jgi:glycosyltransferase involved in cell wall biosynthesis
MIGVVIPAYNREGNLALLLATLERQSAAGFHVVIADDGSTDGTAALIAGLAQQRAWQGRLTRVSCGPNLGVRTGRARNIGAANLPAGTRTLLMLDTDLVLQPDAIALLAASHAKHPDSVLYGAVEWLPPLGHDEILAHVTSGRVGELRRRVPVTRPARVEGTFTGPELREDLFSLPPGQPVPLRPQWALPLNSAWPLDLYWAAGGFDETMTGYGYQDMEFGERAAAAGAQCVPCPEAWALHVWHPKPAKAMEENQRNLDLYLRRHGGNGVSEVDVDWSLWFHYHAERGGTVARSAEGLWAVSADQQHKIALPDESWLPRLGHCVHAGTTAPLAGLVGMTGHGTARLPPALGEPAEHLGEPGGAVPGRQPLAVKLLRFARHPGRHGRRGEDCLDCFRECRRVIRGDQQAGYPVLDHVLWPAAAGSDYRYPGGCRLQDREAEAFLSRCADQDVQASQEPGGIVAVTGEDDPAGHAQPCGERVNLGREAGPGCRAPVADQGQRARGVLQSGKHAHGDVLALPRLDPPDDPHCWPFSPDPESVPGGLAGQRLAPDVHPGVDDRCGAPRVQVLLKGMYRAGYAYHEIRRTVRGFLVEPEPARDHVLDPGGPPGLSCLLVCQRPVDLRPGRPEHRGLRPVLGHHRGNRGGQPLEITLRAAVAPSEDQRRAPVLRRAPHQLPVFLEGRNDRDPVAAKASEQGIEPYVAAAGKARRRDGEHRRERTAGHAPTGSNMSSQSSGPGRWTAMRKCSCCRRASADRYSCG